MATRPTMTMMIEITIAKMGRRTKNSPMSGSLRRGRWQLVGLGWPRADGHARTQTQQPRHRDALARLQAGLDHPATAEPLPHLHLAHLHRVIRLDDEHSVGRLQFADCPLRQHNRALELGGVEA